ncbi:4821_t:CDS:2 [Racocetra fulgida]|uniref:Protein SDA1 n=1 Tax=Racocetra fulgida TaxID=60492 RepID=A0A9N9DUT3_9GLOM|nr:4821_t:CDS:2 [Racocetra fulgida]
MILVVIAQSCHELVPPDVLEPLTKTGEVMAAGLNAIREICARQPLAIDSTLLQDLTEYKSDRDKGVIMAAKSLIGLFREINPENGKIASMNMKNFKPLQNGKIRTTEQIEGIELLEEYKKQQMQEGVTGAEEDEKHEGYVGETTKDKKISSLATTQLLTPADFFKLNELKMKHKVKQLIDGGKRKSDAYVSTPTGNHNQRPVTTKKSAPTGNHNQRPVTTKKSAPIRQSPRNQHDELPDIVDVNFITGPRKKAKQDYEERIESIKAGREGREKFRGPKKGKKVEGTSTTNKEKARKSFYDGNS